MRFKKILHSPMSTNHSLNARSLFGNDERSFAVRGRSSGSCNVGVCRLAGEDSTANLHLEFPVTQ
jgi:hypothetical protein